MTARRLTFQLTPLLDLLLIVIFAQFMEVQDTAESQEQTSTEQVQELETERDKKQSRLKKLQADFEDLKRQLEEKDKELTAADFATQSIAIRAFELEQELERTAAERKAIASLYPKLFELPDEEVAKLFSNDDKRMTDEQIRELREKFKTFAQKSPGQSAKHLLTVDEMWKRCDVWQLYIRSSGLTVVKAGDRTHQFEATTAKDWEEELYDFYTRLPAQKSLVILLLSYGNIDANVYEAALDGLPKAAERMRSASSGKSRFESAILGFNAEDTLLP